MFDQLTLDRIRAFVQHLECAPARAVARYRIGFQPVAIDIGVQVSAGLPVGSRSDAVKRMTGGSVERSMSLVFVLGVGLGVGIATGAGALRLQLARVIATARERGNH